MAKFCANCGKEVNENADVCLNCGKEIVKEGSSLYCPNCGSNNVNIQFINESRLVNHHHSILWWLFIGWWWIFIKWFFFTVPALIFKIFGIGKRKKIVNNTYKMAVCQKCGKSWKTI